MTTNVHSICYCIKYASHAITFVLLNLLGDPVSERNCCSLLEIIKTKLITYVTPWRRGILNKLISPQLVKKFPTFHETQRYITVFTRASHLSQINLLHVPPKPILFPENPF
jgi:hypothetical protein